MKQDYVLDSIGYLKEIVDLDAQPTFDVIDEYQDGNIETRFPLEYHIDFEQERVYLISIEESYRRPPHRD